MRFSVFMTEIKPSYHFWNCQTNQKLGNWALNNYDYDYFDDSYNNSRAGLPYLGFVCLIWITKTENASVFHFQSNFSHHIGYKKPWNKIQWKHIPLYKPDSGGHLKSKRGVQNKTGKKYLKLFPKDVSHFWHIPK